MISYFRDDRLCEADSFLSVVKPDDTECADGEKGNCSYNNSYERRDDSMELCG